MKRSQKLTACEVCRARVPINSTVRIEDKYNLLYGLVVCKSHVDITRNHYHELKDIIKEYPNIDYSRARENPDAVYVESELSGDAPSKPLNLRVYSQEDDSLTLIWDYPKSTGSSSILGYKIERSLDDISYSTLIANTSSFSLTYEDTTFTTSLGSLYYRVSAINSFGTSLPSDSLFINLGEAAATFLITSDGDFIVDSDGNYIVIGEP